jgi:putative oxidoreductase
LGESHWHAFAVDGGRPCDDAHGRGFLAQSAAMVNAGLLVLRVTVAAVVAAHGAHWLFGAFDQGGLGAGGLTNLTTYFSAAGLPNPFAFAVTAGVAQLGGGLLLVAGLFTRIAAAALIAVEVVRMAFDSARWGFFLNWSLDPTRGHGIEYGVVLMAVLVCLVLTGAGDWSLDGARAHGQATRAAGRARLRERV